MMAGWEIEQPSNTYVWTLGRVAADRAGQGWTGLED